MKRSIIISLIILFIFTIITVLFAGNYHVVYTKEFYYKYIIIPKNSFGYSSFYYNIDKQIFNEQDKVNKVIKINGLFKNYPEIKKALQKAKVI